MSQSWLLGASSHRSRMSVAPSSMCVTLSTVALLVAVGWARAAPPCPVGCVCVTGVQLEYTCDTPGGSLEAYLQPAQFLTLVCHDPAALEPVTALPALPALANSTLPSAELDACRPPRAGWAAALRALGVARTPRLVLHAPEPPDPPDRLGPFWRSEHFAGLEDLRALTLKGGGPAPPQLLAGLIALQRLTLSNIPLRLGDALPLPRGDALRWLELGGAALAELPTRGFVNAPGLRGLVVLGAGGAGGEVRAAPAALEGLSALATLQLRGVALGSLPPRWLALPALQTARLERCALRELPGDLLVGAVRLQNLSLANNALQTLPPALLAGLPALRRLELQGNRLTTLPPALLQPARHLLYLDLYNNSLKRLDDSTFASQSELQTLILSWNNLTFGESTAAGADAGADVGDDTFGPFSRPSPLAPLSALRELRLAHNRVAALPDDWRFQLAALARLDLSYNAFCRLTDADVNIVVSGDALELDLRYNNISSVELLAPDTAAWGGVGPRVLLAGNPLRCDCHLHQLLRRAAPRGSFQLDGVHCAAPPELRGRALPSLPPALLRCALPAPACPTACACELRPGLAGGLLALTCPAPPPAAAWPDPAAYGLPASALRLTTPPPDSLRPPALPPHCRNLSLAGLRLARVPPAPADLPLLDLSDNSLRELPEELAAANATRLLLAGNPWRCDCAAARSVARLQRTVERVDDWAELRCADGSPLAAARVAPCPAAAWPTLVALAAVAAAGALLAAAAALRYARELRGWAAARGLACCWPPEPADAEAGERDERFDAFVSYAHADEAWVVGELVPRLERAGLRLCVHFRDWPAGGWIPAQIERSVRQSRRTLLVVSQHYLASDWAQHEWRAALAQPRPRLVLVLLGRLPAGGAALPAELRTHMSRHTYVKVGDPWFWSKLRVALPRRPVKPAEPAERHRRDVTCKLGFDDRLDALCATPPAAAAPASPAAAEGALLVRLEPAVLEA